MKENTDEADRECLGSSGYGVIFQDEQLNLLFTIAKGLGIMEVCRTEVLAIVEAAELALKKEWINLWIECDSKAVVIVLNTNTWQWLLRGRWKYCVNNLRQLIVSHITREGNY